MNITYIYTPISCCSTSIWHHLSRGTVYMQSKWLFRWKIMAIAFYLGRLGFKPLIRSQVKISLVLSSFLTFLHLTQLLLIQDLSDMTSSPCSKGGCPGLRRRRIPSARDSGVLDVNMEEKRECERGEEKTGKNSKFSLFFSIFFLLPQCSQFLSIIPILFFKSANKCVEVELHFWHLTDSEGPSHVPWLPTDHI